MAIINFLLLALTALAPVHALPSMALESRDAPPPATDNTTLLHKRYSDGEGSYVNSNEGHKYASGVRCWTDWYVVEQRRFYAEWLPASGKTYCTGTQSCTVSKMNGNSKCETWSMSMDAGISSDIINFSIHAGYDLQKCNSATDSTACSWNDGKCHIIWAQQQLVETKGYARRRCHDKGRDYTAWMKEYSHTAPTRSVNYGCGSKCSDSP